MSTLPFYPENHVTEGREPTLCPGKEACSGEAGMAFPLSLIPSPGPLRGCESRSFLGEKSCSLSPPGRGSTTQGAIATASRCRTASCRGGVGWAYIISWEPGLQPLGLRQGREGPAYCSEGRRWQVPGACLPLPRTLTFQAACPTEDPVTETRAVRRHPQLSKSLGAEGMRQIVHDFPHATEPHTEQAPD